MQSSGNTIGLQTAVGLPLLDHIVSEVICQHPSSYIRTVQGQVYCILTKYTVADRIMLKFDGGHIFLDGFTAATARTSSLSAFRLI